MTAELIAISASRLTWTINLLHLAMAPSQTIKELTQIPGVGKSIATDLYNIGIRHIEDLKGKDPQQLYDTSNQFAGCVQDRCILYVFRCAVYYAETPANKQDTDKLKWWNWKDKNVR